VKYSFIILFVPYFSFCFTFLLTSLKHFFQPAEKKANKLNALEITLKDTFFHLYATTEIEKDEWIAQIGKNAKK
jgi:hypothetical protein